MEYELPAIRRLSFILYQTRKHTMYRVVRRRIQFN